MLLISQNKEKVLWFGRAFNALEYSEQIDRKEKKKRFDTPSVFQAGTLKRLQSTRQKKGAWLC